MDHPWCWHDWSVIPQVYQQQMYEAGPGSRHAHAERRQLFLLVTLRSSKLRWIRFVLPGKMGQRSFALSQTVIT